MLVVFASRPRLAPKSLRRVWGSLCCPARNPSVALQDHEPGAIALPCGWFVLWVCYICFVAWPRTPPPVASVGGRSSLRSVCPPPFAHGLPPPKPGGACAIILVGKRAGVGDCMCVRNLTGADMFCGCAHPQDKPPRMGGRDGVSRSEGGSLAGVRAHAAG